MSRAKQFIELQAKVNKEIDTLGQATTTSVNELEWLGDSLTPEEINEVCEQERAFSLYERGLSHG